MRCNPFGYATDAGPASLMGGLYGPEYAGKMTTDRTGIHGVAVCESAYAARYRLICGQGHTGPVMELCERHAAMIARRMSSTCTRCVWPPAALEINEAINRVQTQLSRTYDLVSAARLRDHAAELGRQMDDLIARGIIARRPLQLVEVS
ncbi:MAG TPA: hypothetical protein VK284_09475 [Streptosporangiaceae bacterium]|jgi:hypothetical protein|nr:hypothetical protein [Streptosporangiaceae bacterium]